MNYNEYLKSDDWKQLKGQKYKKKDRKCAFCASVENLDVHHMVYAKDLGDTTTGDLRVLCRKCHSFTHFLFNNGYIKFRTKTRVKRFTDTKRGFTRYFGLKKNSPLFGIWSKYEYKDEFKFRN